MDNSKININSRQIERSLCVRSNNYWTIVKLTSIVAKHSDRLPVQSNNYWTIVKLTSIVAKHSDRLPVQSNNYWTIVNRTSSHPFHRAIACQCRVITIGQ
ncbi:hypothetical protein [Okeania sp. SIO1I7]|uniref:hypothetical protein n=1 Tax=Okeania sp. SIO1I7 TaxID=2607772 RepID=UPI0013F6AD2B|nr:hypothetical protein [Okeania sp. SIO1I7]NET27586.1 hypothetical protein [Okeania sp. SIO1I7]